MGTKEQHIAIRIDELTTWLRSHESCSEEYTDRWNERARLKCELNALREVWLQRLCD